jgi:hypothetical protein
LRREQCDPEKQPTILLGISLSVFFLLGMYNVRVIQHENVDFAWQKARGVLFFSRFLKEGNLALLNAFYAKAIM